MPLAISPSLIRDSHQSRGTRPERRTGPGRGSHNHTHGTFHFHQGRRVRPSGSRSHHQAICRIPSPADNHLTESQALDPRTLFQPNHAQRCRRILTMSHIFSINSASPRPLRATSPNALPSLQAKDAALLVLFFTCGVLQHCITSLKRNLKFSPRSHRQHSSRVLYIRDGFSRQT